MFAAAQITAPSTMTRRSKKQAVSAAHIILRCHGVGYSFMFRFKRLPPTSPTSDWFFQANLCLLSSSSPRFYPRAFCFLDREPALFPRRPMLPASGSILGKCRLCVQRHPDRGAPLLLLHEASHSTPDRICPFEIPPSRGYPGTRHCSGRSREPV